MPTARREGKRGCDWGCGGPTVGVPSTGLWLWGMGKGEEKLSLCAFTRVYSLQEKGRRTTRGDTWESRLVKTGSRHLSGKVSTGTARREGREHRGSAPRQGPHRGLEAHVTEGVCRGRGGGSRPVPGTGRRAVGRHTSAGASPLSRHFLFTRPLGTSLSLGRGQELTSPWATPT